ncbi:anthranilate synthase component I family protein [Acinetobacter qingfengensis]|nr:anthranilate synthase component I family protein [Acinetobacter qingfengensis]
MSQYFGFVFLQDQDQPFFACYPKQLQLPDDQQLWQRQADFSYVNHTQANIISIQFNGSNQQQQALSFQGGYIAFISYDFAAAQWIKPKHPVSQPTIIIAEYDLIIKQVQDQWILFCDSTLTNHPKILQLIEVIGQVTVPEVPLFTLKHAMQARWQKQHYQQAFTQVQNYLHAGDCYQINLTQEFFTEIQSGKLLSLLPELLDLTQAPFAGYIAYEQFELLSCSPELFIEFSSDGKIITRPIKGTLPRHADPKQDQALKQQLSQSEKDQAENLMIVDLLRNDLSVYAKTGSVNVPSLFEIESFAQVHHMVSEIQATLKPNIDPWQMLLSALPGGSITGAPKIRAMQIIDELEGDARGAYCGSLGYFNYDGSGRFNILIRSLQRYQNQLSIWAGGGITVASQCEAEYQECLDKVSALLNFINQHQ